MNSTDEIFKNSDHRPWEMPKATWSYYQEWNRALFLHWRVPAELLRPSVPSQLDLDFFGNETWVSLVAFTMEQIRPRHLPAIGFVSNFDEINLRTYVRSGNKSGVYFLSIEAGKSFSAYTARMLSGLPYERASIFRLNGTVQRYKCTNIKRGSHLDASFVPGTGIVNKTPLELFLTEKYCLYMEKSGQLFRYDIHHKPWNLYEVEQIDLKLSYRIGETALSGKPDLIHYSDGVKVIAWNKVLAENR